MHLKLQYLMGLLMLLLCSAFVSAAPQGPCGPPPSGPPPSGPPPTGMPPGGGRCGPPPMTTAKSTG